MNAALISHASFGVSTAGVSARAARIDQTVGAGRTGAITASHSRGASDAAGRLALTRRGRLVFLGIPAIVSAALLLFLALAIMAGSLAGPANAATESQPVNLADYAVAVTVLQGDSLWSIAAAADPGRDARHVVREIVALNDLGSGILHAGQRLYVPIPK
ncbi:LysM peptidoglycan-binding domain-containing protein [Arthrobacter sp. lap29]|uniref:LysM peptidoglycan-binding domain-containing protein n=1 Tax=Arthrobacter sp. lap29 TaxID=3056122 RepID=UPI0028F717C0|nr:LysM peptidoglycan-binding domain-containing protein [Arthrobacter sp. lap29]